jgi:complement component 1 Q subcomponent-binding protein
VAARPLRSSAIAFQPSFKLLSRPAYAAFSTSKPQFESAGQADPELSAKLADEYSLESESGDVSKYPEAVHQFLENGPWEVKFCTQPNVL